MKNAILIILGFTVLGYLLTALFNNTFNIADMGQGGRYFICCFIVVGIIYGFVASAESTNRKY